MNCSTRQALDVWADLEDAYQGRHGYGGDTAEIYGYRLRSESPARGTSFLREEDWRADLDAAFDLRTIAAAFEARRECRVFVVRSRHDKGTPIAEWLEALTHRAHLRVVPRRHDEPPDREDR